MAPALMAQRRVETYSIVVFYAHLPDVHRVNDGPHAVDDIGEDELAVVCEAIRWKGVSHAQVGRRLGNADSRSISAGVKGTLWINLICWQVARWSNAERSVFVLQAEGLRKP